MAVLPRSPIPVYKGPFTERDARRLLWRAGFGPAPGQARELAARGLDRAVRSLTRPAAPAKLIGVPPHDAGLPLDPVNVFGHDHCWWLDRMVRSSHHLIERMTLIWHGWLTSSIDAATSKLMLDQNWLMRESALGNFHELLQRVTCDPAMLLWLNGNENTKSSPNENYGREVMELFTLGADRGAYTQRDVHEQARALTGFTNDWSHGSPTNFRFDPTLHDQGAKTIFGHRGRFDWQDTCRLCVEHPLHPSFFVAKLWRYFIPVHPPVHEARALEHLYHSTGFEVRPVVEALLRHPLFYRGPRMIIPPVVYCAGLLRALGRPVDTDTWAWVGVKTGQRLFQPPNVAGWDYTHWLDTARWAARFSAVAYALRGRAISTTDATYSAVETPSEAVASALMYWDSPSFSSTTHDHLLAFAQRVGAAITHDWQQLNYRILRQNALRALVPATPEWQTC